MSKKNSIARAVKNLNKGASKAPVVAPANEVMTVTQALAAGAAPLVKKAKGAKKDKIVSEAPSVAPAAIKAPEATQNEVTKSQAAPANATASAPATLKCFAVQHANGAALTVKRPGVLAHIERMLRTATAEAPVSKADMLASLVVAFADRDESKMKVTLNMQCPSGFRIEKGFIISSNAKGYYFDVEKTAEYQATHEKRDGAWRPKATV